MTLSVVYCSGRATGRLPNSSVGVMPFSVRMILALFLREASVISISLKGSPLCVMISGEGFCTTAWDVFIVIFSTDLLVCVFRTNTSTAWGAARKGCLTAKDFS